LDVEQTSVGGEADLPQRGQVGQPSADGEVVGVVDGGLGLLVETHIRSARKALSLARSEQV